MTKQQIDGGLRARVGRTLADVEGAKRMIFWKAVFIRFDEARR